MKPVEVVPSTHPSADDLARLFEDHIDAVFGFLVTRCGSRQVAEDVSSDTFAEAARVFVAGRAHEVSRGWLLDVARKRLIDYWRRSERQRLRIARFAQFAPRHAVIEIEHEEGSAVLDALDTLPTRQRAALMLRYLDGYSVSEVAEALGATYPATESLLARGRRSLLAAYEGSLS